MTRNACRFFLVLPDTEARRRIIMFGVRAMALPNVRADTPDFDMLLNKLKKIYCVFYFCDKTLRKHRSLLSRQGKSDIPARSVMLAFAAANVSPAGRVAFAYATYLLFICC